MNATAKEVSGNGSEATKKTKAEVEVVQMSDGRKVEFAGKRKLLKESFFKPDGTLDFVRLDFRNRETRDIRIPSDLKFGDVLALHQFAAHGIEQKYGDETAGTDDVDDMTLEIDELDGRIQKGEWSTRREGGGMAGTSVLLRALVEYSGKTAEQIKDFLSGKSQVEKMALRNSPKIKPIVEKLEQDKLAKGVKVDTDALLGALA